jgi:hypothetical protein
MWFNKISMNSSTRNLGEETREREGGGKEKANKRAYKHPEFSLVSFIHLVAHSPGGEDG